MSVGTWVQRFELEGKRQIVEWQYPQNRKLKKLSSVNKVTIIVFWDFEGMIHVDVMPGEETVLLPTSGCWENSGVFQMSSASQESNRNVTCGMTHVWRLWSHYKFGWTLLPHPPYSPDLLLSDFHLFGAQKDVIHNTKFDTDDDVICAGRSWQCWQDKVWCQQDIHTLVSHWCRSGLYWKIGYGVKVSLFSMYNFHGLGTDI